MPTHDLFMRKFECLKIWIFELERKWFQFLSHFQGKKYQIFTFERYFQMINMYSHCSISSKHYQFSLLSFQKKGFDHVKHWMNKYKFHQVRETLSHLNKSLLADQILLFRSFMSFCKFCNWKFEKPIL